MPEVRHDADELLLGLARALRAAGVPVAHDRVAVWLRAATLVGLDDASALRSAGHATLCSSRDELALFDRLFELWFGPVCRNSETVAVQRESTSSNVLLVPDGSSPDDGAEDGEVEQYSLASQASTVEALRHRDVATLSGADKMLVDHLIATMAPRAPRRRTRRRAPNYRGSLDAGKVLRHTLRNLGEPGELAWQQQARRPRRVVLLVDVSKSMAGYADAHLRVTHRFLTTVPGSEAFTLGTRLTRITTAMRTPDPERALASAGRCVPDWAGGTRLGENLEAFIDRWGQRGAARGAVVVIFSDGWEQGDAALLARQAQRLRRIAHRVIWVNPHRAKDGYEPLQSGIKAVLPFVDDFLGGHSQATFQALCDVVARG